MTPTARRTHSRRRLAIGFVALVAAVIIMLIVTDGAEPEPASVATAPTTVASASTDDAPALDESRWQSVAGTWAVDGASARVETADSETGTYFVTNADEPDSTVRARLDIPAASVGLVFRFRDPSSYWAVEGAPGTGLWQVVKVVDGRRVEVGVFDDPICCSPGALMSVSTTASRVVVSVDSLLLLDVDDAELADNRGAGLFAGGGDATDAHFSAVAVIDRGLRR